MSNRIRQPGEIQRAARSRRWDGFDQQAERLFLAMLKRLSPMSPLMTRRVEAQRVALGLEKYSYDRDRLSALWCEVASLLEERDVGCHRIAFDIMNVINRRHYDELGPLRVEFLQTLQRYRGDSVLREQALMCLVHDGKKIDPFAAEVSELLLKWLQENERPVHLLGLLQEIMKFAYFSFAPEVVTAFIVEIDRICRQAVHTNALQVVDKCWPILDIMVRFGRIPPQALSSLVRCLMCLINVRSDESYNVVSNLLLSSCAHPTLREMLNILGHPADHHFSILRGAVFCTGMATWGHLRVESLGAKPLVVLDGLRTVVECKQGLVIFEVLLNVGRLVRKMGPELLVEWTVIFGILRILAPWARSNRARHRRANQPVTMSSAESENTAPKPARGSHVSQTDHQADRNRMSGITGVGDSAAVQIEDTGIPDEIAKILTTTHNVYMQERFGGDEDELMEVFEIFADDLSPEAKLQLLSHKLKQAVPWRPRWQKILEEVSQRFYIDQSRPILRLRCIEGLEHAWSQTQYLQDDRMLQTTLLPVFRLVHADPDMTVCQRGMNFMLGFLTERMVSAAALSSVLKITRQILLFDANVHSAWVDEQPLPARAIPNEAAVHLAGEAVARLFVNQTVRIPHQSRAELFWTLCLLAAEHQSGDIRLIALQALAHVRCDVFHRVFIMPQSSAALPSITNGYSIHTAFAAHPVALPRLLSLSESCVLTGTYTSPFLVIGAVENPPVGAKLLSMEFIQSLLKELLREPLAIPFYHALHTLIHSLADGRLVSDLRKSHIMVFLATLLANRQFGSNVRSSINRLCIRANLEDDVAVEALKQVLRESCDLDLIVLGTEEITIGPVSPFPVQPSHLSPNKATAVTPTRFPTAAATPGRSVPASQPSSPTPPSSTRTGLMYTPAPRQIKHHPPALATLAVGFEAFHQLCGYSRHIPDVAIQHVAKALIEGLCITLDALRQVNRLVELHTLTQSLQAKRGPVQPLQARTTERGRMDVTAPIGFWSHKTTQSAPLQVTRSDNGSMSQHSVQTRPNSQSPKLLLRRLGSDATDRTKAGWNPKWFGDRNKPAQAVDAAREVIDRSPMSPNSSSQHDGAASSSPGSLAESRTESSPSNSQNGAVDAGAPADGATDAATDPKTRKSFSKRAWGRIKQGFGKRAKEGQGNGRGESPSGSGSQMSHESATSGSPRPRVSSESPRTPTQGGKDRDVIGLQRQDSGSSRQSRDSLGLDDTEGAVPVSLEERRRSYSWAPSEQSVGRDVTTLQSNRMWSDVDTISIPDQDASVTGASDAAKRRAGHLYWSSGEAEQVGLAEVPVAETVQETVAFLMRLLQAVTASASLVLNATPAISYTRLASDYSHGSSHAPPRRPSSNSTPNAQVNSTAQTPQTASSSNKNVEHDQFLSKWVRLLRHVVNEIRSLRLEPLVGLLAPITQHLENIVHTEALMSMLSTADIHCVVELLLFSMTSGLRTAVSTHLKQDGISGWYCGGWVAPDASATSSQAQSKTGTPSTSSQARSRLDSTVSGSPTTVPGASEEQLVRAQAIAHAKLEAAIQPIWSTYGFMDAETDLGVLVRTGAARALVAFFFKIAPSVRANFVPFLFAQLQPLVQVGASASSVLTAEGNMQGLTAFEHGTLGQACLLAQSTLDLLVRYTHADASVVPLAHLPAKAGSLLGACFERTATGGEAAGSMASVPIVNVGIADADISEIAHTIEEARRCFSSSDFPASGSGHGHVSSNRVDVSGVSNESQTWSRGGMIFTIRTGLQGVAELTVRRPSGVVRWHLQMSVATPLPVNLRSVLDTLLMQHLVSAANVDSASTAGASVPLSSPEPSTSPTTSPVVGGLSEMERDTQSMERSTRPASSQQPPVMPGQRGLPTVSESNEVHPDTASSLGGSDMEAPDACVSVGVSSSSSPATVTATDTATVTSTVRRLARPTGSPPPPPPSTAGQPDVTLDSSISAQQPATSVSRVQSQTSLSVSTAPESRGEVLIHSSALAIALLPSGGQAKDVTTPQSSGAPAATSIASSMSQHSLGSQIAMTRAGRNSSMSASSPDSPGGNRSRSGSSMSTLSLAGYQNSSNPPQSPFRRASVLCINASVDGTARIMEQSSQSQGGGDETSSTSNSDREFTLPSSHSPLRAYPGGQSFGSAARFQTVHDSPGREYPPRHPGPGGRMGGSGYVRSERFANEGGLSDGNEAAGGNCQDGTEEQYGESDSSSDDGRTATNSPWDASEDDEPMPGIVRVAVPVNVIAPDDPMAPSSSSEPSASQTFEPAAQSTSMDAIKAHPGSPHKRQAVETPSLGCSLSGSVSPASCNASTQSRRSSTRGSSRGSINLLVRSDRLTPMQLSPTGDSSNVSSDGGLGGTREAQQGAFTGAMPQALTAVLNASSDALHLTHKDKSNSASATNSTRSSVSSSRAGTSASLTPMPNAAAIAASGPSSVHSAPVQDLKPKSKHSATQRAAIRELQPILSVFAKPLPSYDANAEASPPFFNSRTHRPRRRHGSPGRPGHSSRAHHHGSPASLRMQRFHSDDLAVGPGVHRTQRPAELLRGDATSPASSSDGLRRVHSARRMTAVAGRLSKDSALRRPMPERRRARTVPDRQDLRSDSATPPPPPPRATPEGAVSERTATSPHKVVEGQESATTTEATTLPRVQSSDTVSSAGGSSSTATTSSAFSDASISFPCDLQHTAEEAAERRRRRSQRAISAASTLRKAGSTSALGDSSDGDDQADSNSLHVDEDAPTSAPAARRMSRPIDIKNTMGPATEPTAAPVGQDVTLPHSLGSRSLHSRASGRSEGSSSTRRNAHQREDPDARLSRALLGHSKGSNESPRSKASDRTRAESNMTHQSLSFQSTGSGELPTGAATVVVDSGTVSGGRVRHPPLQLSPTAAGSTTVVAAASPTRSGSLDTGSGTTSASPGTSSQTLVAAGGEAVQVQHSSAPASPAGGATTTDTVEPTATAQPAGVPGVALALSPRSRRYSSQMESDLSSSNSTWWSDGVFGSKATNSSLDTLTQAQLRGSVDIHNSPFQRSHGRRPRVGSSQSPALSARMGVAAALAAITTPPFQPTSTVSQSPIPLQLTAAAMSPERTTTASTAHAVSASPVRGRTESDHGFSVTGAAIPTVAAVSTISSPPVMTTGTASTTSWAQSPPLAASLHGSRPSLGLNSSLTPNTIPRPRSTTGSNVSAASTIRDMSPLQVSMGSMGAASSAAHAIVPRSSAVKRQLANQEDPRQALQNNPASLVNMLRHTHLREAIRSIVGDSIALTDRRTAAATLGGARARVHSGDSGMDGGVHSPSLFSESTVGGVVSSLPLTAQIKPVRPMLAGSGFDAAYVVSQLQPLPGSEGPFEAIPFSDKLRRAVNVLDRTPVVDTHKIAVLYVTQTARTETDLLLTSAPIPAFVSFLKELGEFVDLLASQHQFTGGLDVTGRDGRHALVWRSESIHTVFHVPMLMNPIREPAATRMNSDSSASVGTATSSATTGTSNAVPSAGGDPLSTAEWTPELDEGCIDPGIDRVAARKRHVGNDNVSIVFIEPGACFDASVLPGQFNFVFILVEPLGCLPGEHVRPDEDVKAARADRLLGAMSDGRLDRMSFRVTVDCKPEVPLLSTGAVLCRWTGSSIPERRMHIGLSSRNLASPDSSQSPNYAQSSSPMLERRHDSSPKSETPSTWRTTAPQLFQSQSTPPASTSGQLPLRRIGSVVVAGSVLAATVRQIAIQMDHACKVLHHGHVEPISGMIERALQLRQLQRMLAPSVSADTGDDPSLYGEDSFLSAAHTADSQADAPWGAARRPSGTASGTTRAQGPVSQRPPTNHHELLRCVGWSTPSRFDQTTGSDVSDTSPTHGERVHPMQGPPVRETDIPDLSDLVSEGTSGGVLSSSPRSTTTIDQVTASGVGGRQFRLGAHHTSIRSNRRATLSQMPSSAGLSGIAAVTPPASTAARRHTLTAHSIQLRDVSGLPAARRPPQP